MPSEHRLHPTSILFALARGVKVFALPAVLLIVSSGRSSPEANADGRFEPGQWASRWVPGDVELENWQFWLLLLLIPNAIVAVAHYLSFRVRYEGAELVIRSGILFRNERHVPYHRIQNLDATRTLIHRLFGVTEVRVETGGGSEPEARISVLHETVFKEMQRRVLEGRTGEPGDMAAAVAPVVTQPETERPGSVTLLHLPLRELFLLGALENRGMLLVAAGYGALWEMGLQRVVWERLTNGLYAPGLLRDTARRVSAGEFPPLWQIAVLVLGLLGLLVLIRLLSMAWAALRLYDFRLARVGMDLRTEYGLLTRVTATIPIGRVQTLTVLDTPLQRLVSRRSVRLETAGGHGNAGQERRRPRERIAPIIRTEELRGLVRQVLPQADLDAFEWQPVHPRAFRRAVKPNLFVAAVSSLSIVAVLGWRVWPAIPIALMAAAFIARKQVQHLAWAASDDAVAVRSGWLWRNVTVVPVVKIQTVSTHESPFDRRMAMAGVQIDTAGGSELSQRVRIPYLARETAGTLHVRLSALAAQTAFRW